jgi:membrane protease YdiL (CAAX protease family)
MVAFYLPVGVVSATWMVWEGTPMIEDLGLLGLGLLIGVGIALLAQVGARWGPLRALEEGLAEVFVGLRLPTVVALAVSSAVAEELLFRGVLLPWVGPWTSSLLFALVHVPHRRSMWVWPVFAFGMGLALAGLTLATGDLGAAIGAHFALNLLNLHALQARSTPEG